MSKEKFEQSGAEKTRNKILLKITSDSDVKNNYIILPIVDSHMHIQSNDIAPLPIMYSMLRNKLSKKDLPRGKINYVELSYLKESKYDYDPSDDTIYIDILDQNNTIVDHEKIIKQPNTFGFENPEPLMPLMKLLGISLGALSNISYFPSFGFGLSDRKFLTNVTALTKYGQVTRSCSYLISGLYFNEAFPSDLSYPSRWRKSKSSKNEGKSIWLSNFTNQSERNRIIRKRRDETLLRNIYWYLKETSSNLVSSEVNSFISLPKFSCMMGMELMYSHYWGAYGIPLYLEDTDANIYTIDNFPCGTEITIDSEGNSIYQNFRLNFPYDIKLNSDDIGIIDLNYFKKAEYLTTTEVNNNKGKYNLFLKKIPETEAFRFEDHWKHVYYQKVAAVKYPLSLLPFYHLDIRRFFSPDENIGKYFNFYKPFTSKDNKILYKKEDYIEKKIHSSSIKNIFRNKSSEEELKEELVNLHKNNIGLFWGIKMYVALGYPPYISCNDGKRVFPFLKKNDYSKYKNFLEYCADNDIPITCHGSPQGMTIGDSEVYLKEYLKHFKGKKWTEKKNSDFNPNIKGMMLGLGLIDDFSSPDSWKVILKEIKGSLKLCLAHFGGKSFFIGENNMGDDENEFPYSWQEKFLKLITGDVGVKHRIYTDLSNYSFRPFKFPQNLSEKEFNKLKKYCSESILYKYYEISTKKCIYELNDLDVLVDESIKRDIMQIRFAMLESHIVGKEIDVAATNIANLIRKDGDNEILRYRIMYGTDYPMFEGDVCGVQDYMSSTFIFYQLLTHKLGSKWDAWHQFTVINPLKYLGLIEDDDSAKFYTLKVKKLEKLKENLIFFNKEQIDKKKRKPRWGLKVDFSEDEYNIKNAWNNIIKYKETMKIPNAELIRDKDGYLMLTGEKK